MDPAGLSAGDAARRATTRRPALRLCCGSSATVSALSPLATGSCCGCCGKIRGADGDENPEMFPRTGPPAAYGLATAILRLMISAAADVMSPLQPGRFVVS